jgi:hypothetical protein
MASATLQRISKRRPSWPTDTLTDCSRQQRRGYDAALSHIDRRDNHRRGSKIGEPSRGPSRAPKFCDDSLYRSSGAEPPPQDLKMLGVAGVHDPAISQPINIVCCVQRQTIKNQKRWAMATRGAVPGSRLLPTCRAAILQSGSPPSCRAAML